MIQPKSIYKTGTKRTTRRLVLIPLCCLSALLFFTTDFRRQLRYTSSKNLLIINGLNKEYMLPIAVHNRLHTFTSQEWDCAIFSDATYEEIQEDHFILENLKKQMNCNIMRMPSAGFGDFLFVVNPTYVNNYNAIALMAADTYFPEEGKMALSPKLVMDQMKELEIGTMQPIVIQEDVNSLQNHKEDCITPVERIPTMAQFFTREAWACYYNMLHYTGSTGGCYDLCMNKVCPDVKQAIDGRFVGFQLKNSQQVEAMEHHDYFVKGHVASNWLEVARSLKIESSLESDMEQDPFVICEKYECGTSTETTDTDTSPLWCEATDEDAETLGSSR